MFEVSDTGSFWIFEVWFWFIIKCHHCLSLQSRISKSSRELALWLFFFLTIQFDFRPDSRRGMTVWTAQWFELFTCLLFVFKFVYEDIVIDSESIRVVSIKLVRLHLLTSLTQVYLVYGRIMVSLSKTWSESKICGVKEKRQVLKRVWYTVVVSGRLRRY